MWLRICLCGILLLHSWSAPISAARVILALNCGSGETTIQSYDQLFKYVPDTPFVTESVMVDYLNNEHAASADIKYTLDKSLFLYERHAYQNFTYSLPVRKGRHTIILKFAEMYFTRPGQRVFNVKIGKKSVIQNLDVVARSGSKFAAHEEFIEVTIENGKVYFNEEVISGALHDNKLKLSFSKGKADNPIVQAIIVYHTGIQESPRKEYEELKNHWDSKKELQKAMKEESHLREMLLLQKKKEKTIIRNDQLVVPEVEQNAVESKEDQRKGLRAILMGWIGIPIWGVLFYLAFRFLKKEFFFRTKTQ